MSLDCVNCCSICIASFNIRNTAVPYTSYFNIASMFCYQTVFGDSSAGHQVLWARGSGGHHQSQTKVQPCPTPAISNKQQHQAVATVKRYRRQHFQQTPSPHPHHPSNSWGQQLFPIAWETQQQQEGMQAWSLLRVRVSQLEGSVPCDSSWKQQQQRPQVRSM